MKHLEHEGKTYSIPETIWEMDLGPWLDLMAVLSEGDNDDLNKQMRIVSIMSNIPLEQIHEMDYARFVQLAELCTLKDLQLPAEVTAAEAGLDASKAPITFEVEGETFEFQPDYALGKMRVLSRVEDMLRGVDLMKNLHALLALTAFKKDEVFYPDAIDQKAALMCKAKMSDVFRPLFFFALQGRSSLLLSRLSSLRAKATEVEPIPS